MSDLHLVLTFYWFDEIAIGNKTIEYRENKEFWRKRILEKDYDRVIFHRGYTSEIIIADMDSVDLGECPYEDWDDTYIRIHFSNVKGGK